MRSGKDLEDTHESMKAGRVASKYEHGPKRHVGRNRLKHKSK